MKNMDLYNLASPHCIDKPQAGLGTASLVFRRQAENTNHQLHEDLLAGA